MFNKKTLYFTVITGLFFTLLYSCSPNNKDTHQQDKTDNNLYGGVLRLNNEFEFRNLYPPLITETVSHRIANQIYESLVDLNPKDLSVRPALAERWEVNDDATSFTFYLRKGIYFHNDTCFPNGKGRELTAYDIKYCFDKLCEYSPLNQMFWLVKDKVKGANEYYELSKKGNSLPESGVKGFQVIDKYTFRIELNFSFALLPTILTHSAFWIYPKEAFEKYQSEMRIHPVGSGPFVMKKIKEGETVVLTRNTGYWKTDSAGNQLPYLDGIKFLFLPNQEMTFLEFKKKNIDFSYYISVMGKEIEKDVANHSYQIETVPALGTGYITFNCQTSPFNNEKVRQAFQYAIDVPSLLASIGMHQEIKGIVPPIPGYPFFSLKGIDYNPEKARQLLAEAGYKNGKNFPDITLYASSNAEAFLSIIQKMINDNLNINLTVQPMPYDKLMDLIETGNAPVWINGWLADYPDPENFLNLFYGKNVPNTLKKRSFINPSRYVSAKFDHYFEMALKTIDFEERNRFYALADQTALDEGAFIPYRYSNYSVLYHNYLHNLYFNGMKYFKFENVYLDKTSQRK